MSRACSTYGEKKINLIKENHLEDPGLDGGIILKWIFEKRGRGINWIDLAVDRDRWRVLVNVATSLRVHKMRVSL
jgi:hypothetical protein